MKKLMMFAAAMTIVGGAYASACGDPQTKTCALVYDFKANLKTTVAKAGYNKGDCEDVCYRTPGSVSLKGYLYSCEGCDCDTFVEGMVLDAVAGKKNADYVIFQESPAWIILNLIGKTRTQVETFWAVELTDGGILYMAGFGKTDKTGLITAINGSAVGYTVGPDCINTSSCSEAPATAYPLCDLESSYEVPTVGFGTWAIKYNKGWSKKVAEGASLPTLVKW